MAQLLPPDDELQLRALWARRSSLASRELETLCLLIMRTLRRCAAPELSALRESDDPRTARDRYINDFLMAKVLDAERFSDSPLESVGALVFYFRNFLKTAIRSERFHRDMGEFDEGRNAGEDDEAACGCADAGSDAAFDSESAIGWLEQARQFVRALETRYQVLLLSYCADEPVFSVARRYNIASAAHHAGKLGITKKHGGAPPAYGETLIGRWMAQTLGIDFAPNSQSDILRAMEALCAASFELRTDLEAGLDHA
jgi:hypothetical protein